MSWTKSRERVALEMEILVIGRDAGIADQHGGPSSAIRPS